MNGADNILRKLEILTGSNNMEVYINIKYIPQIDYKFEDKCENSSILDDTENRHIKYLPIYSPEEIIQQLKKNNIIYGILEDALAKCSNVLGVDNLLIAKGKEPVEGTDDFLEIKFKTDNANNFIEDSNGNVDFKSIGFVDYVEAGTVLAVRHKGTEGSDGKDVYGNVVKHKPGKKINIRVGAGCCIRDANKIIALKAGKPSFSHNTFYVHKLYEINSDVDIKTGNIKFNGAVIVKGSVREDMMVESGDSVEIKKNIEKAKIIAKGDVTVDENVIFSTVVSGREDTINIKDLNILLNLKNNILNLINTAKQLQRYNRFGDNVSYGEIVKLLMENRFKSIPKLCNEIININEYMYSLFIEKLFNLAPLKIKHWKELFDIVAVIDENIDNIKEIVIVPTNVNISYCQDSIIESSGSIIINGKGEYVSRLIAKDHIVFTNTDSVARGGIIKAGQEVRCGIVGSLSGVSTKISVERNGHIYVNKAYENTIFSIGNREYILEVPSKEIHAYLNNNRELIVDKLLL